MIINRIKQFLDYKGVPVSRFEKEINASEGTIRNAIKKSTEINSKWLVIISEKYPEINLVWLLTGKGNMLLSDVVNDKVGLKNYSIEEITAYLFENKDTFRKNTVYKLLMENELKEMVIDKLKEEKEKLLKKKIN